MFGSAFMKQGEPISANSYYETKFRGPDGTVFDLADHPWVGAAPAGVAEVTVPERKTKVPEPAK